MVKVNTDLTGQKFGRLTVVKQVEDYIEPKSGRHRHRWLCECECGNQIEINGNALTKRNGTKSCGCFARENMSRIKSKPNKWDLDSFDYGVGYTSKNQEFWFDKENYDKVKNHTWYINKDGYVVSTDRKTLKTLLMHRIVVDCPDGLIPDHIHGKASRFDNRKSNLRIATSQENCRNKGLFKNNTSGVTGVEWHKRDEVWQARIKVDYKYIHLGYFDSFDDAVKARKEAEEKYFGEYSYDNSQNTI